MKKNFQIKKYTMETRKLSAGKRIKIAFLTDLHGVSFGKNNEDLVRTIEEETPDLVISAGDMNISSDYRTLKTAAKLMEQLAGKYPVYYALGNHEARMCLEEESNRYFLRYCRKLERSGVRFLNNVSENLEICGEKVTVQGLNIPLFYYKKPRAPYFGLQPMQTCLSKPDEDRFSILAAHNPRFGDTYFAWGSDLILSGHYHGGQMRFTENCGAISPQFVPFPKYCCGRFIKNNSVMIVSSGLGEHTVPFRIHNPRELVIIQAEGVK